MADQIPPAANPVINDPPPPGVNAMDQALIWIGFDNDATRERIQVEGFALFDDLKSMKEKDVRDFAESYGRRTAADGRFLFGVRRIRYLIGMIHWVQDFVRIGENATLDEFDGNGAAFCAALETAFNRADVRKIEKELLAKLPTPASLRMRKSGRNGSQRS